jgi:formylglycine-generating enzyme required for sulfatase activity
MDREQPSAEDQRQAEYERQQKAQTTEQKRKQEATQRSAEQYSRGDLRHLTLAPGATMDFVRVPAGKFLMGSTADNKLARDNECPQHTVEIPYDYWSGRYPVTNAQFARFVTASEYKFHQRRWKAKANHPVVGVSWQDAMAYCQWLNATLRGELKDLALRLPTEAEWEKAARSEYGNEWPWGNEFDKGKCNSREGRKDDTTPVGAYSPQGDSPYGAADMAGNVREWCHSLYKRYPYQAHDGRESESGDNERVLRGGSWGLDQDSARCAHRDGYRPDSHYFRFGFRCLLSFVALF